MHTAFTFFLRLVPYQDHFSTSIKIYIILAAKTKYDYIV